MRLIDKEVLDAVNITSSLQAGTVLVTVSVAPVAVQSVAAC